MNMFREFSTMLRWKSTMKSLQIPGYFVKWNLENELYWVAGRPPEVGNCWMILDCSENCGLIFQYPIAPGVHPCIKYGGRWNVKLNRSSTDNNHSNQTDIIAMFRVLDRWARKIPSSSVVEFFIFQSDCDSRCRQFSIFSMLFFTWNRSISAVVSQNSKKSAQVFMELSFNGQSLTWMSKKQG